MFEFDYKAAKSDEICISVCGLMQEILRFLTTFLTAMQTGWL